jgi:hypothetical protein
MEIYETKCHMLHVIVALTQETTTTCGKNFKCSQIEYMCHLFTFKTHIHNLWTFEIQVDCEFFKGFNIDNLPRCKLQTSK